MYKDNSEEPFRPTIQYLKEAWKIDSARWWDIGDPGGAVGLVGRFDRWVCELDWEWNGFGVLGGAVVVVNCFWCYW